MGEAVSSWAAIFAAFGVSGWGHNVSLREDPSDGQVEAVFSLLGGNYFRPMGTQRHLMQLFYRDLAGSSLCWN